MRALGLDLGSRRVGVAVCDSAGSVATPVQTLIRSGDSGRDRQSLVAVVREWEVEVVVVGLPLSLNGSEGPAARAALAEVEQLRKCLDIPVLTHDERLTTVIAQRRLSEQELAGRDRRRVVDQVAAAVMLQSWLDAGMPGG